MVLDIELGGFRLSLLGKNLRSLDIGVLGSLVAAAQHDDQHSAALHEVEPVARAVIDPRFRNAFANRLHIAEIAQFEPAEARNNAGRGMRSLSFVSQAVKTGDCLTSSMCTKIHGAMWLSTIIHNALWLAECVFAA